MKDIFTRVDSLLALPQVLERVTKDYLLGDIKKSLPILTGYQDCNIDLETSEGRFIVKIFSAEKTKQRIDDIVWGHTSLPKKGVPLPTLRNTANGNLILEIPGHQHTSYLCVFDYFVGMPLTQVPITDADITSLTKALTVLHSTKKIIHNYYDTIAIVNVPNEYKLKKIALPPDEQSHIDSVVSKLLRLDMSAFRHGIIHGALEKENVVKNTNGELCLLDLGCMDYNAVILDIATFIANFTQYSNEEKRSHIIRLILDTYNKSHPLSSKELSALPTLIRAQYAAHIISMTYHMRLEHDMTKQTQTWLDRGWYGLKAYQKITSLV